MAISNCTDDDTAYTVNGPGAFDPKGEKGRTTPRDRQLIIPPGHYVKEPRAFRQGQFVVFWSEGEPRRELARSPIIREPRSHIILMRDGHRYRAEILEPHEGRRLASAPPQAANE